MNDETEKALAEWLLGMADDELILAHRNSEWIGHAPILEEDIALANIAQDELGHAMIWYGLRQELTDDDPDKLVYFRDANQYRNVQLVEQPKGDWAVTMLRQFFFDAYELALLTRLAESTYTPLADATTKIKQEEIYHFRHTRAWVLRLAQGTDESHRRMQAALDQLWPFTAQLFAPSPATDLLTGAGIIPALSDVASAWENVVLPHLIDSTLCVPESEPMLHAARDLHTAHLADLLADLQQVAREDPEAVW